MKKNTYLYILPVVSLLFAGTAALASSDEETPFTEFVMPMEAETDSTVTKYNETVDSFSEVNAELEALISQAQDLLDAEEPPYDESTADDLSTAIAAAEASKERLPEYLEETEPAADSASGSVLNAAEPETGETEAFMLPELPDYTEVTDALEDAMAAYEESVQIEQQITAPTEAFLSERLQQIDTITDMAFATEGEDPDGKLNQKDGYIGAVYFLDSRIDRTAAFISDDETSVLKIGVKGGGAIEICASPEDAAARDLALAASDGTVFSSGSHTVLGSMVIRTSSALTTMDQEALTEQITNALLEP